MPTKRKKNPKTKGRKKAHAEFGIRSLYYARVEHVVNKTNCGYGEEELERAAKLVRVGQIVDQWRAMERERVAPLENHKLVDRGLPKEKEVDLSVLGGQDGTQQTISE